MQKIIRQEIIDKDQSYDIIISDSILQSKLKEYNSLNALYIIDHNISSLYSSILPKNNIYIYQAEEKRKTFDELINIIKFITNNKGLRTSLLVAIGGGITGDITGFAASVYMRGIDFIQIPTTYLAMVDSSIGGKTAINFNGIKNNIGAFYQPIEVIIDLTFLSTLSDIEFLNGFAETIKIAAIADADLFFKIRDNYDIIIKRDKNIMLDLIDRSCRLKSNIVKEDTYEKGIRKLLNFGHTLAHAIEVDSDNTISHGYAVVLGMIYEMKYGLKTGLISQKSYENIYSILNKFNYQTSYKIRNKDLVLSALSKDKKATSDGISLILTDDNLVGKIVDNVLPSDLITIFE